MIILTAEELAAMKAAIRAAGVESPKDIQTLIRRLQMIVDTGKDGKKYAWFYDGKREGAAEVGNPEHTLSRKEIENILGL